MFNKTTNGRVTGIGSHPDPRKKIDPPEIHHQHFATLSVIIGIFTYGVNIWLLIDVLLINPSLYDPTPWVAVLLIALLSITNILNSYIAFYSSSHFFEAKRSLPVRILYLIVGLLGFGTIILLIECIFNHNFLPFPYEFHGFLSKDEIDKTLSQRKKTLDALRIEHENELKNKRIADEAERKEKDKKKRKEKQDDAKTNLELALLSSTKTGESKETDGDDNNNNNNNNKDTNETNETKENITDIPPDNDDEKKESKDNKDNDDNDNKEKTTDNNNKDTITTTIITIDSDDNKDDNPFIPLANSQIEQKNNNSPPSDSDDDDEPGITGITSKPKPKPKDKDSKNDKDDKDDKDDEKKDDIDISLLPKWKQDALKRAAKRKELELKQNEETKKREEQRKLHEEQLKMEPIEMWLEKTQDLASYTQDSSKLKDEQKGVLIRLEGEEESRILIPGFAHSDRKVTQVTYTNHTYDYYDDIWGYNNNNITTHTNGHINAIAERLKVVTAADYKLKKPANTRLRFMAAKIITFERSRAIEGFFTSMPMIAICLYLLSFEELRFETDGFVNGMVWIVFAMNLINFGNIIPRWMQANFLFTSAKSRYPHAMKEMDWFNWQRSLTAGVYFMLDIIIRVLPCILYVQIEKKRKKTIVVYSDFPMSTQMPMMESDSNGTMIESTVYYMDFSSTEIITYKEREEDSYWMLPIILFACEFFLVYMATQFWRWFKNNFAPTKNIFVLLGNTLVSLFSQYFFFSLRTWNMFCGVEMGARYIASLVLFGEYSYYNLNDRIRPTDVWGVIFVTVVCVHFVWGCMWSVVRYQWLEDLDRHLGKEQRYVSIPHKPNVQNTSSTEQVPNTLELFNASLIPGFIPETVSILKHYRQEEEFLLKKYVENDDGRIRELERRKIEYKDELERWRESERQVQAAKLKREKELQEQISKGQYKSTLEKSDKDAFAKDMSFIIKKRLEKFDPNYIPSNNNNNIYFKGRPKDENNKNYNKDNNNNVEISLGISGISGNDKVKKAEEEELLRPNKSGGVVEEEDEDNNDENKVGQVYTVDREENVNNGDKENTVETKEENDDDGNEKNTVNKHEKMDSLGQMIQDAIVKQGSGVTDGNANENPSEPKGNFVD